MVVTAYTLAFGGFLLLGGRIADFVGRKKAFLIGLLFRCRLRARRCGDERAIALRRAHCRAFSPHCWHPLHSR